MNNKATSRSVRKGIKNLEQSNRLARRWKDRFSLGMVTYLLQVYTYEITTADRKQFTCVRRQVSTQDNLCAPPEELTITLGMGPKADVWGKSLIALYNDLERQIAAHVDRESFTS